MDNIPIGDRPADNVVPLRGEPDPTVEAQGGGGEEEISWEEAVARDAEAPPPEPGPHARPNADLTALVEQGVKVGLGLAVAAASAAANGLRAQIPKEPDAPPKAEGSEPFSLFTGALLGAVVEAAELTSKTLGSLADAARAGGLVGVQPAVPARGGRRRRERPALHGRPLEGRESPRRSAAPRSSSRA